MHTEDIAIPRWQIQIPLQNFRWDGEHWEIAPGIHLDRCDLPPVEEEQKQLLAPDEQQRLSDHVTHWLSFRSVGSDFGIEIANLFVFTLWLVKPSKTQASFVFRTQLVSDGAKIPENSCARLLNRMQWVENPAAREYTNDDLALSSKYFDEMMQIAKRGRLNNAIMLTLHGCWQDRWQGAIVLFASAVETLITYSTKLGLTNRLAIAYACLLGTEKAARDAAYTEFKECYVGRSDVVHGRGLNINADRRLELVARWGNVLRAIWSHVLNTPQLLAVLELDDAKRESYILRLIEGYLPPTKP